MHALLFTAVAAVLVLSPRPSLSATSTLAPSFGSEAIGPTPVELALFHLSNQDRIQAGLTELAFDGEALRVARARAEAQIAQSELTHFDANGRLAFADLLRELGLPFKLAGENLARVPGPASVAPQRAEMSLMNSPSHRANILEPSFDLLAVGAAVDPQGRVVFAQVFRSST